MCGPTSICRCAQVLNFVGRKAGLALRYHSLYNRVQRTREATEAYQVAARLAALSGRLRNASRNDRYILKMLNDRYILKMLHNISWDDLAAANRSVQRYATDADGVL